MPRLSREAHRVIERNGRIPKKYNEDNPTLHFCREWDFLLIDDGDVEFEACLCYRERTDVKD